MINIFAINGFRKNQNLKIKFDAPYKILLSENGRGKTTILNTLNSVLNHDILRLQKMDFESIEISFKKNSRKIFKITKDQLKYNWESRAYDFLKSKLNEAELNKLIKLVISGKSRNEIMELWPSTSTKLNPAALRDLVEEKDAVQDKLLQNDFFDGISDSFNEEILYLPTYRRVEENLENFGIDIENFSGKTINFGLDDVKNKIESIRNEILQLSNTSFNSVSGELLTKMINTSPVDEDALALIRKQRKIVPLVLNRVGKTLSRPDQEKIIRLVDTGEIFSRQDDSLAYFLSKLIDAYQKQKDLDESLKRYADICRDYFTNKEVIYDENRIQVDFKVKDGEDILDVNHLSSGEKQIASLFASIYLYGERKLGILFDEPELSLSVEWQERLLTDIAESGRCTFMLAMTHSPFIFKAMTKYTSDLSTCFTTAVKR